MDLGFTFVVKALRDITLTHKRGGMEPNPAFLSPELSGHFLERLSPIKYQVGAVIPEFEYLNHQKMPNQEAFLEQLTAFVDRIPRDLLIALEPRNGSYLDQTWFSFLEWNKISHVFSEKQYMPPIDELYARYTMLLGERGVLRPFGRDRKAIREASGGRRDKIIEPKPQLPQIARMIADLVLLGARFTSM